LRCDSRQLPPPPRRRRFCDVGEALRFAAAVLPPPPLLRLRERAAGFAALGFVLALARAL